MDNSGNNVDEMISDCINKGITNINEKIKVIITQTNYDKSKALHKLLEMEYDEIRVIKDYMGIDCKEKTYSHSNNLSTQQKIYKSFREFF